MDKRELRESRAPLPSRVNGACLRSPENAQNACSAGYELPLCCCFLFECSGSRVCTVLAVLLLFVCFVDASLLQLRRTQTTMRHSSSYLLASHYKLS